MSTSYVWTSGCEIPHVVKGTPAEVNAALQRGPLDYYSYEHRRGEDVVIGRTLNPGFTEMEGIHGEPVLIRGALVTGITTEAELPW